MDDGSAPTYDNFTVEYVHFEGAIGTPGLGYPLLLCLGKSLVVFLNYALTAE